MVTKAGSPVGSHLRVQDGAGVLEVEVVEWSLVGYYVRLSYLGGRRWWFAPLVEPAA